MKAAALCSLSSDFSPLTYHFSLIALCLWLPAPCSLLFKLFVIDSKAPRIGG